MKKKLLIIFCISFLLIQYTFAQTRTVTGTVLSKEDGLPLPGVTVKVKGSTIGAQTSVSGKFSLAGVPPNSTLVFTYISYSTVEKVVPPVGAVDVQMEATNKQLGEVVVTGTLGRKLEEKATGYASTHLTGAETNESSEVNLLTGLTGKVAGLQVTTTGTGVTPGIKVQLRGSRSINSNNQALIVVDGVPLPNGDISAIDPNTIESFDVLNGGSAGVLYGSEASNGVIVITTKKGSASGKPQVTYSNSIQASIASYYPAIQKQFGQLGGENVAQNGINPFNGLPLVVPFENELFGPAYDGHTYQLGAPAGSATGPVNMQTYDYKGNPIKDFYNTGITEQNNIAISSGNGDDYFNVSAQQVIVHGITPFETNQRYNATLKAGKRYGIFKAEYSVSYTNNLTHQVGTDYNGNGQGVNYAIGQFPTDLRIKDFQDPNGQFSNPSDFYDAYAANPYWSVYNSPNNTTTNTLIANLNLTLSPTKYLDINYKITDNYLLTENKSETAEVDFSPYSVSDPFGQDNIASGFRAAGGVFAGEVTDSYSTNSRLQSDFIINLHPTLSKDFKTNLLIGNSFYANHVKNLNAGSNTLLINGLYNIKYIQGTPNAGESETTQNNVSFYADATVGYKGWAFIDGSVRNEADSRLVASKRSYWYPGVSGSFVFTDAIPALKDNKVLSFGKLRAAYSVTAQIGVGAYNIFNTFGVQGGGFPYGGLGGLAQSTTNHTLIVPERVTEYEFGAELGFLDNLIHGSFTYYKQNDRNQTLSLGVSQTTGFSTILTNVGELQSSGYEASITVSPLTKAKNKVGLDIGANLANQESKVISLLDNVPQFSIGSSQFAVVGQQYPLFEGSALQTDPQGRYIVSTSTGQPSKTQSSTNILGRSSPEWILGLNGTLSYKFMSFNVVAEYRGGFVSDYASQANILLFTGSSAYSTQAGRQRFIFPNSSYLNSAGAYVPNTNIATNDGNWKFWATSQFVGTASPFITSGAFWKIREANLSFNLNQFVKNMKAIKGLKFSLTGRNLFIWVPKTNFWGDPETSAATSANGGQVTSINSIPGQRIFGGKLDVTF